MAETFTYCNASGAPINNSHIFNKTVFQTQTFALTEDSSPAQTLILTPAQGLPLIYTDVDLQKAIRLTLELFIQGQVHN